MKTLFFRAAQKYSDETTLPTTLMAVQAEGNRASESSSPGGHP